MTARYTNVRTYKRGVKRDNGQGRHCVLTACSTDAAVSALNVSRDHKMEVYLCQFHAVQHGVLQEGPT
jgi:hypothetical protein